MLHTARYAGHARLRSAPRLSRKKGQQNIFNKQTARYPTGFEDDPSVVPRSPQNGTVSHKQTERYPTKHPLAVGSKRLSYRRR